MARWTASVGRTVGTILPLENLWGLAEGWYRDRLSPGWRRRSPQQAEALFQELGLVGDFWRFSR